MDLVHENLQWAEKHYKQLIRNEERELKKLPSGNLSKKRRMATLIIIIGKMGNTSLSKMKIRVY